MTEEMRKFHSPVFGETRQETKPERELIKILLEEVPASVFGALNKKLNERGLCIHIKTLQDKEANKMQPQCQCGREIIFKYSVHYANNYYDIYWCKHCGRKYPRNTRR